ncbi:transposase [Micromonospora echinospora]
MTVRVPSARPITAWIMRPGRKLTDDDHTDLADARCRCPDLDTVADLARRFCALVRHQGTGQHLDAWIDHARNAGYPELRGFAAGLASDRDAVVAGLTQLWSSGPVEGHVNRIMTIKRQMYGREPRPPPQTRPRYPISHAKINYRMGARASFQAEPTRVVFPLLEPHVARLEGGQFDLVTRRSTVRFRQAARWRSPGR